MKLLQNILTKRYDLYLWLVIFLAVLSLSIQIYYFYHGILSIYDDAFITFRYSQNLAGGLGPVFNPGEAVEGYTNFLWMLILAKGKWIGFDIPYFSQILGIISTFLMLFFTYHLGLLSGLSRGMSVFPVLLLALNPGFARFSVSGMETNFFTLWLLTSLVLLQQNPLSLQRVLLSSFLLVLATLTRPEGLLFTTIFFIYNVYLLIRSGNPNQHEVTSKHLIWSLIVWLIPWIIIYLPYLLLKVWYYGDILPNTFYVKVGISTLDTLSRGLYYIGFMLFVINLATILPSIFLPWIRWSLIRKMLAICTLIYLLYIIYIGGDHIGTRLLLPVIPFLLILGISALEDFHQRLPKGWGNLLIRQILLLVILIIIFLNQYERERYVNNMKSETRGWMNAGEWITSRSSPEDLIAVDAAGIIPYITNLRSVDMYGLNDRYIARLPAIDKGGFAAHEKYAPNYVLDQEPDYVFSWIDRDGMPYSAGLSSVVDRFFQEYKLTALVHMRDPKVGEPEVVEIRESNPQFFDSGYIYGIFSRKD